MLGNSVMPRTVRSFARREGRITRGQRHAMDHLWPHYGVDSREEYLDLDRLFGRSASRVIEIGLGMGDALVEMAKAHPENDYIGVEVYRPGVGSLLKKLDEQGLSNVRVVCEDTVEVLKKMIPDASLAAICIFFPDPWPKRRHHKRRLIQSSFIHLLGEKLKSRGILHMATDWEDYARHMLSVMDQAPEFTNTAGQNNFAPRPDYRPLTKFEQRGQRLGHGVWDLIFKKNNLELVDIQ